MEEGCRGKGRGGGGETGRREKCRSGGRGGDSSVETGAPCSWRRERESGQTQREVQTARQTALLPNRKVGLATGQFNICPHLTCSLHPPEQGFYYNRAEREERRDRETVQEEEKCGGGCSKLWRCSWHPL